MRQRLEITVKKRGVEMRHLFDEHTLLVGRHPGGDLVFETTRAPEVSKRHAVIHVDGDRVRIRDLESTNGTYVNGLLIYKGRKLETEDVVALGLNGPTFSVRLVNADSEASEEPGPRESRS